MARPDRPAQQPRDVRPASARTLGRAELIFLHQWCWEWAKAQPFWVDGDDAFAGALEYLAKHIEYFGDYFPRLFLKSLPWRMVDWLRQEYGRTKQISTDRCGKRRESVAGRAAINHATDFAAEITLTDSVWADPTAEEALGGTLGELERIMPVLSYAEEDVIRRYYLDQRTLKEIGHAYGLTESRISQIHNAALKKLKAALRP